MLDMAYSIVWVGLYDQMNWLYCLDWSDWLDW